MTKQVTIFRRSDGAEIKKITDPTRQDWRVYHVVKNQLTMICDHLGNLAQPERGSAYARIQEIA